MAKSKRVTLLQRFFKYVIDSQLRYGTASTAFRIRKALEAGYRMAQRDMRKAALIEELARVKGERDEYKGYVAAANNYPGDPKERVIVLEQQNQALRDGLRELAKEVSIPAGPFRFKQCVFCCSRQRSVESAIKHQPTCPTILAQHILDNAALLESAGEPPTEQRPIAAGDRVGRKGDPDFGTYVVESILPGSKATKKEPLAMFVGGGFWRLSQLERVESD